MEMLTAEEARNLGRKYAQAGLSLTPKDCKPIDEAIFAGTRGLSSIKRLKAYNTLRGSFNAGWNEAYAASVCAG